MKRAPRLLLSLTGTLCLLTAGPANAFSELVEIKNQNFGGLELIRACNYLPCDQIDLGIDLCGICGTLPQVPPQEPLVNLVSHDMLYFNYEIPAANVPALEEVLQAFYGFTDNGFSLAPIALLKESTPKYYMSLNYYSVVIAGVVNYRSEWSTYVTREGDPKPRFMVLQVQSSEDTADPMFPGFTNPAPMSNTTWMPIRSLPQPMTSRRGWICRLPEATSRNRSVMTGRRPTIPSTMPMVSRIPPCTMAC